jgi:transcriptional regulator with XRE-family HTH domain
VDDLRLGSVVRMLRIRKRWRQADLALAAGVSREAVSLMERGHAERITLGSIRRTCTALEIRLDQAPRWRGGDLDRLLNARHAAMAEAMAVSFHGLAGWILRPEVSFSVYGERGVVDFAAWHPVRRALLLIELKTELVDIGDLMATADRRRRLASRIGRDQAWDPLVVGVWVVLANRSTNLRRIREHSTVLRAAFPAADRAMRRWLRDPAGSIAALSVVALGPASSAARASTRRVRRPPDGLPMGQIE